MTPDPDDDLEIEVMAAPPPPRRPRAQNPDVDNVIHSGEIQPRSLVVKSSQPPPFATESQPGLPVTKPRRFGRLSFLVASFAPAVAAIVLRVAEPPPPVPVVQKPVEAEQLAQLVATTLDSQTRSAQLRVETIASQSMLRAGVQTDAATLADMVKDKDLVFSLGKGEQLAIYRETGAAMLAIPAGTPEIAVPTSTRVEQQADQLSVVVGAPITKQDGGSLGTVALVVPIELPAQKFTNVSNVKLVGLPKPIVLGGGAPSPKGTPVAIPIVTPYAKGLSITATLAAPTIVVADHVMLYARYACAIVATLFLLLYVISVIVRR